MKVESDNKSKLLLCCDEYIYRYGDNYYFKNQEWYDFFHRYLRVFDTLRLVTRCKEESSLNPNRVTIDDERIEYVPLPFFQGPKQYASQYFKIGKVLDSLTNGCQCAILRLPFSISERLGKALIKKKFPYALEIVYDAEDAWKNSTSLIGKLLWKKIDRNMRQLAKHANGISCVTEFYLQKHYFSDNPHVFVSNYSSLALDKSFYTSSRRFPHGKEMTIANVANQIEFGGRKGHNEIIKAIAVLKQDGIIVNAKFAGEDYNGGISKLTSLANELGVGSQVKFVGYLQRASLSNYLEDADIYAMPTKAEGLPRVIIEAIAKGLPCITSNVSGNSELIEQKYLIDNYYDIQSWAAAIKTFVTSSELYEEASRINFSNSLKYEASVLQEKRDRFYSELKRISE